MLWDAESLCGMIRSMSTITIMGGFNSVSIQCCVYLVKRLELDALLGQEVEDNEVHREVRDYNKSFENAWGYVAE